jgi:hypothetical protein
MFILVIYIIFMAIPKSLIFEYIHKHDLEEFKNQRFFKYPNQFLWLLDKCVIKINLIRIFSINFI